MHCCLYDLRDKEVINSKEACKMGNVCDVEIDSCTGKIISLIIYGKGHSVFGKGDDIKIKWEDIEMIGADTILVKCDMPRENEKINKKGILEGLFR